MIQHQVNNHAGDRDVEPQRQGPAGDPAMAQEVMALRSPDGYNHKRDDHRRQESVRTENRKVHGPGDSLPCESRHAMMRVVNDVGNQKEDRSAQCRDLAISMSDGAVSADKEKARRE